jgi:hypothetical protein
MPVAGRDPLRHRHVGGREPEVAAPLVTGLDERPHLVGPRRTAEQPGGVGHEPSPSRRRISVDE